MNSKALRNSLAIAAALAALTALAPTFAADGDKSKIKGLITSVQGDTIVVKDANNAEQTITVSPATVYKKTKGLTGVVHEKAQQGALMPGLPITADVVAAGSGFNATEISFKSEDFRTAQQVQAGLAPTTARMNDFGTYEALETTEVLFDSGKTTISAKGKSDLDAFAAKAKDTRDYQVVLQGFTDSTGNAEANQRLSTMRAAAVANYLQQQAGLAPGRVRAGDGMGVASDAGTGSNASARKVVVKLVVDKGVQAGNP
jgi:outer membrane protein OmpA-like peptidoglycan-associated protein